MARLESGHTPSRQHPEYWVPDDCTIPWFSLADVWQLRDANQKYLGETSERISPLGVANSAARVLPAGTVVLSRTASVGFSGIMRSPMATTQDFANWVCGSRLLPEYLLWAFRAMKDEFGRAMMGSTHQTIYMPDIRRLAIPVPPLGEQRGIADFLDRKTAAIDSLIEKKERVVALLAEKRQAVMARTVSKGLNSSARMKDSGVDWIGQVPEHWEVRAIKRDTLVKRGASPRPIDDPKYFDDDGEYAWVRISDVTASGGRLRATEQRLSNVGSALSVKLQPGELFLSIAGSVGKPCIAAIKCCIHDGFVYFPRLSMNRFFLKYIFEAGEAYRGLGKLGTQLNLNTDTVGGIRVPYPPRQEQDDIVASLDSALEHLDRVAAEVASQLEKLREYRQALITAAVTGQLDVTEEQAA